MSDVGFQLMGVNMSEGETEEPKHVISKSQQDGQFLRKLHLKERGLENASLQNLMQDRVGYCQ